MRGLRFGKAWEAEHCDHAIHGPGVVENTPFCVAWLWV